MKRILFRVLLIGILLGVYGCQAVTRLLSGVEEIQQLQSQVTQLAPTGQALLATAQAAATQVAPTAQAAATQWGTAQALVTQLAPTAQAVATQVAPTLAALTEGETPPAQGWGGQWEQLRTFREHFVYEISRKDTGQTWILKELDHRVDREGQISYLRMTTLGQPTLEVLWKADQVWIRQGDTWSTTALGVNSPQEQMQAYLASMWGTLQSNAWEFVGTENDQGFQVKHYRWETTSPIPPFMPETLQTPEFPATSFSPRRLEAHVWITEEGYTLKSRFLWEGDFLLPDGSQVPGTLTYLYEVLDINQPVDIPNPEAGGGLASAPVPLPPGAQLVSQQGAIMWMYLVPTGTLEDLAQFYRQELPAQGYQVLREVNAGAQIVFQVQDPGGKRWNVVLAARPGGGVDLMIQSMP